jgi:uncharacterized protein with HEPN domain
MTPEERDQALLWSMREAAEGASEVASDVVSYEALLSSRIHQLALAKALELIGEAASKLSGTVTSANKQIPWPQVVNLRHRIVHDYSGIDFKILWNIVQQEVPSLLAWLQAQLPADDEHDAAPA